MAPLLHPSLICPLSVAFPQPRQKTYIPQIAGRVLVKNGEGVSHHLVHVTDRPILRIPTIAIHLERTHNVCGAGNRQDALCVRIRSVWIVCIVFLLILRIGVISFH
jgi:hypothetical protein